MLGERIHCGENPESGKRAAVIATVEVEVTFDTNTCALSHSLTFQCGARAVSNYILDCVISIVLTNRKSNSVTIDCKYFSGITSFVQNRMCECTETACKKSKHINEKKKYYLLAFVR